MTVNQVYTEKEDTDQAIGVRSRFFYGYILVISAACIMALFVGTSTAFGVFFMPVLKDFGWTRATTSGAFSLSWILQGILAIAMGRLTDRFGPRLVMTLCGFLLGVGYLLTSQMNTIAQFYLFYGIIGIGMSGLNVSLVSTVARWFVKRRGMMTGLVMAGGGIGSLITPPAANWFIALYSWRESYIIMGALVLIFAVFAAQFLRRDPANFGQLPYGYKKGMESHIGMGTGGLTHRETLQTRPFWMVFSMFFSLGFCAYVFIVHMSPHATDMGITASQAANILATIGGTAVVGRIVMGTLGDRIGNRLAFIMSYAMMSIAVCWLIVAKEAWMLYVFTCVLGFTWGVGALGSPLMAELFGLRSHGTNLGVINFAYSIGAAVGPFAAGYIFDMTHQYHAAFIVTLVIVLASLLLSIFLRPASPMIMEEN